MKCGGSNAVKRLKKSRGRKEVYTFPSQTKQGIMEVPIKDQASQFWLLIGMRGILKAVSTSDLEILF